MLFSKLLQRPGFRALQIRNSSTTYVNGYTPRPFLATLSGNWFYVASASFAAFMYFVMSSPLSEIGPAGVKRHINQYTDKWYFLHKDLEEYVKQNYDQLKKDKTSPQVVLEKVWEINKEKNKN